MIVIECMHTPSLQHTVFLFEKIAHDLPPLVPKKIVRDMAMALDHLQHNYQLTAEEAEATLITFGKKIWPYRQAFADWCERSAGELGESFFLGYASVHIKKRYHEFCAYGGSFRDIYGGKPAPFFTPDERVEITKALVAAARDVRAHAAQVVTSTGHDEYLERVEEFRMILGDIEIRLSTLRRMADEEQEHPELSAEIRAQVRAFEEGLCLLGVHISHEAVRSAPDHFIGRKKEKTLHFIHSQKG